MEAAHSGKFCFAGNRFFVLQEMLSAGLDIVAVFAMKGSYLARELTDRGMAYEEIVDKKWLVNRLSSIDFDFFVSNGLPVILPISLLSAGNSKLFVNIHPSYLPDLRGIDPVPGSILHGRSSGATCHFMNDEIDGGDIIAQVLIPYSEEIECGLLYQLSFQAEADAFRKALASGFKNSKPQIPDGTEIYYNLREEDKRINFDSDATTILRQVRAFNTRSQGAYFIFDGYKVVVRQAVRVTNAYALDKTRSLQENEIAYVYENSILVKKNDCCLQLRPLEPLPEAIRAGCLLQGF